MCPFNEIKKKIIPISGLFDTEEKVRKVREWLEKATEKNFKKIERLKRLDIVNARNKILD